MCVDYVKLHMHEKISRINTKRMEIMYTTYKPVEGAGNGMRRKNKSKSYNRLKEEQVLE